MSKRKNTLNDLEEFLKLQASTLVPPQPVEPYSATPAAESRGGDSAGTVVVEIKKPEPASIPHATPISHVQAPVPQQARPIDLLAEMKNLASRNKNGFYDFIIQTAESLPNGTNDVLLINTALYLKHGDNWKQGIEEYWSRRKKLMVNS